MSLNTDILTDALRLAGVLSETEAPSAEQGKSGLRTMNDLFLEWEANNIDTGYFQQSDLQAESPIYSDAMLACKYGLALAICTEYGLQPKPIVAQIAGSSYGRIQREAVVAKQVSVDMTHLPGVVERDDIINGQ